MHNYSIESTLAEIFFKNASIYKDKPLFFHKRFDQAPYVSLSWKESAEAVRRIANAFRLYGVEKSDRLAILSENRPEWAICDLACQAIGAISIPIYNSLTAAEISYILEDSQCKVLCVSSRVFLERVEPILKNHPKLTLVIAFDSAAGILRSDINKTFKLYAELLTMDAATDNLPTVNPDDPATIIYTSGTTGKPKGVVLTHQNFISNMLASEKALKMGPDDKHLSFLPLSHVFERMAGYYLMLMIGASIAYAQSLDTVSKNILEVKPTFILGVPRFFEKIKAKVFEKLENSSPGKRKIFSWAIDIAERYHTTPLTASAMLKFQFFIANFLVFSKFKKSLGGRIRFCVSGGAPLQKEIADFFYSMNILILEGYGLTETSPVITVNRLEKFCFGTVGLPLDSVEVKIAPDGEILTKSLSVMRGYWGRPIDTQEVIKDGWFHTGDLGCITSDGFLKITGRKKEIIVTSGGKKISPRFIEEMFENDPLILRSVLFGEGKKYLVAVIVPEKDKILEYARESKIVYGAYAELLANPAIYRFYETKIENLSKDLASYEKVKYFVLLEEDFSIATGELTPTLKVKREAVYKKNADRINALYPKE